MWTRRSQGPEAHTVSRCGARSKPAWEEAQQAPGTILIWTVGGALEHTTCSRNACACSTEFETKRKRGKYIWGSNKIGLEPGIHLHAHLFLESFVSYFIPELKLQVDI